jgi:3'(2'), 5'-bisphosphate nucleotidase
MLLDKQLLARWLDPVRYIATEAGVGILEFYHGEDSRLETRQKSDDTPVTQADLTAHTIIHQGLTALAPNVPILSEEDVALTPYETRKSWDHYWLIDPLDGTRGFIAGLPEFSVNIALIEKNRPVMGVIYSPVEKILYWACAGTGAFKQEGLATPYAISTRPLSWDDFVVTIGHFHGVKRLTAALGDFPGFKLHRLNSSLKLCALADGTADIYPRIGPTSEWDTAAGQCILEEAGGAVVDLQQDSLQYNARESVINGAFFGLADPRNTDQIISLFNRSQSS